MKILDSIKKVFAFSKIPDKNMLAAKQSMDRIYMAFATLDQKSLALQEKYPEQREKLHAFYNDVITIEPSVSVRAGKFEQVIAQTITKVSTECDRIFTTKNTKSIDKEIENLGKAIRERQNADLPE